MLFRYLLFLVSFFFLAFRLCRSRFFGNNFFIGLELHVWVLAIHNSAGSYRSRFNLPLFFVFVFLGSFFRFLFFFFSTAFVSFEQTVGKLLLFGQCFFKGMFLQRTIINIIMQKLFHQQDTRPAIITIKRVVTLKL